MNRRFTGRWREAWKRFRADRTKLLLSEVRERQRMADKLSALESNMNRRFTDKQMKLTVQGAAIIVSLLALGLAAWLTNGN